MSSIDKKKYEDSIETPPSGEIKIGQYNKKKRELEVRVKNITYGTKGIQTASIAVWKNEDQSDLQWIPLTLYKKGVFKTTIDIDIFDDEEGKYNIHAYVVDGEGELHNIAQKSTTIK